MKKLSSSSQTSRSAGQTSMFVLFNSQLTEEASYS